MRTALILALAGGALLALAGCQPTEPPPPNEIQKPSGRTPDPSTFPKGGNVLEKGPPSGGIRSVPGKGQ